MSLSIIDLLSEPDRSKFSIDDLEELLASVRERGHADHVKLAAEVLLERCPRHVAAQAAIAWATSQARQPALPQFLEPARPKRTDVEAATSGTITLREILTRARDLLGRAIEKANAQR